MWVCVFNCEKCIRIDQYRDFWLLSNEQPVQGQKHTYTQKSHLQLIWFQPNCNGNIYTNLHTVKWHLESRNWKHKLWTYSSLLRKSEFHCYSLQNTLQFMWERTKTRDDCMWRDFEWHCSYLPKWTDLYHHVHAWLCTCTQVSVYLHVCVDSPKGTVQTPHWSCDKHIVCCGVTFIRTSLDRIDSSYSEHRCCRPSEKWIPDLAPDV